MNNISSRGIIKIEKNTKIKNKLSPLPKFQKIDRGTSIFY